MKQRIILTADDYGFCDQVDKGILEAANSGYITSVAAFSNGPDYERRLGELKIAQGTAEKDKFDVGCHLTITSGKPLTDEIKKTEYKFVTRSGYFLHYGDLKFPRLSTSEKLKRRDVLKEEMLAQIKRMQDCGINVTNLSSHHNTLTFHPDYLDVLLSISNETGIPIRSYKILPGAKESLYQLQWRFRLKGENENSRIRKIRKFFRNIEKYVEQKKIEFQAQGLEFPYYPEAINGRNYVLPPPPLTKLIDDECHQHKARKKSRKTFNGMKRHKLDGVEEYCFHLCDHNEWQPEDLNFLFETVNGVKNEKYYPGVTSEYFEGRRIEMLSLPWLHERVQERKAKGKSVPEFIKWSQI